MCKHNHDIRPNVQCLLIKGKQILLGKRKGDPKEKAGGTYGVPAGHIEEGESIVACAQRELQEETSVTADFENMKAVCLAEETSAGNDRHYLHIGVLIPDWSGEIQNMEPEKCAGWSWYELNNLPSPLFSATAEVIKGWQNDGTFSLESD
jgi:8-oxo-dGTP diphosphatase